MIDIVVATCDRLPLLQRTLDHIWARTRTPYQLTVIDDCSTEGNASYIQSLVMAKEIAKAVLRRERCGIVANLREARRITESDPIVFTDDDVLCPDVNPDWLAQGLAALKHFPQIGILALNNPQCNLRNSRRRGNRIGPVTLCRNVGGTFAFIRRAVLDGMRMPNDTQSPLKALCLQARAQGWEVGYLTTVYCHHIGAQSVRATKNYALLEPVDPATLAPPEAYRR